MKQLTIAEIKSLDHKMPVPSFVGTIHEVYEQKTGVGEYGPWFLQNLMVSDDTGEVTVTWGGEDPFDQGCKGKTYSFECSETKHGLKGVSWERRKKDGKTYENVKVTQSAKIKLAEAGPKMGIDALEPQGKQIKESVNKAIHKMTNKEIDETYQRIDESKVDKDWPEAPPIAPERPVQLPVMSKDDYWRRKENHDVEVQKFIIRQHSQTAALGVLDLKQKLGELTIEDLTPSKLRALADYFDQDVFGAAS